MKKFEKLGAFYLGRLENDGKAPYLYDSKDLTTHGLAVGMTGSGKTGLSVVLLEEAALDGVPALIIDPKGDMGNLALRFPNLAPASFLPWIDNAEATKRGLSPERFAADTAATWENGLSEWGQPKSRIRALERSAEVSLYTPGSNAGRPIALLRAFDAPPEAVRTDPDALRERVLNAVSGLLGLVGVEADPVTSREHILISKILERAWSDGEHRDLETILHEIQKPPFEKLGVMDLESFFPAKERFALTARLNNLLASPAFAAWREGEPLDIAKLLWTDDGKPRLAVLSIAHLSDQERMFFVTLLLNEVLSWMRSLDGTGSLRAIVYMDEIYGYFPPVKNPPSKPPMLTLLKQARAYGVGVLLATQNPVDLDYKGLANIGTWFLGRLQTERDRERLMDGLSSASNSSGGAAFDSEQIETTLASLDKRVFLAHNVHEDAPVLFRSRWALSYLRGPLTLQQIKSLEPPCSTSAPSPRPRPKPRKARPKAEARPQPPSDVEECFFAASGSGDLTYYPAILASVELHYVRATYGVDHFEKIHWLTPLDDDVPDWDSGEPPPDVHVREAPSENVAFAELPPSALNARSFKKWQKSLLTYLYRERPMTLYRCKELKMISRAEESEAQFRSRLVHASHEKRDERIEALRKRYATKLAKVGARIRTAEQRVDRETSQYSAQKSQVAISVGETLLGMLFGRKLGSRTNVGRASRAARSASRAKRERDDIARAKAALVEQKRKLAELERDVVERTRAIRDEARPEALEVEPVELRFRKSDTVVARFALAWSTEI